MARRKKLTVLGSSPISWNWRESYPGIILGLIVVAVIALLIYNYFTAGRTQAPKIEQAIQQQEGAVAAIQLPTTYEVLRGDSLSKIATKFYNDANKWTVIAKENNLVSPSLIHAGNILKIPKIEAVVAQAQEQLKPVTEKPKEYVVKRGDTLWEIAEQVYGNGSQWAKIFNANNLGRLPNGNPLIHADNVLVIPD